MACIDHGQKAPRYGSGKYKGMRGSLHRIAYCKHNGIELESIKGLTVLHACDNPRCINPSHLSLGTQSDNIRDMYAKGRGVDKRGVKHHNSKINPEVVLAVRAASGPQRLIAVEHGISQANVSMIRAGKAWAHIQ